MTKEEKHILLSNLCSRLPYHVKLHYTVNNYLMEIIGVDYKCGTVDILEWNKHRFTAVPVEDIKPYLRPMSSMTEEEEKQLQKIHQDFIADRKYNSYGCARADDGWVSIKDMDTIINFLNAHHFDYRGLIPMGLALEAPEGMYEI